MYAEYVSDFYALLSYMREKSAEIRAAVILHQTAIPLNLSAPIAEVVYRGFTVIHLGQQISKIILMNNKVKNHFLTPLHLILYAFIQLTNCGTVALLKS